MGLKKMRKNSLTKRISSMVLTLVMVVNLLVGYTPIDKLTYEEVKAATTNIPYRNVMYYGEWSIYAGQKNYTPDKIPGNYITHLNFAFLDVDKNGNIISCDTWADFENPNVGYSAASGDPWAGVAPAFIQLRNKYPNMRIGFSVGGWTRSGDFPAMAANATTRKAFAENIAKACHLYGYDFVDIDWEYPTADRDPDPAGNGVTVDKGCKGSEADTKNFTYLMQDLRAALDKYGAMDGKYYELSCAMSASPAMMAKIEYDKVAQACDFINMMTYDLCGAWAPYTGHQTALYTNPAYDTVNQKDCQFSVDACIRYLYDTYGNNIDASKIVVGIAPYTRGWAGVQNNGRDPSNPGLFATAEPNSVKAADGTTSGTFAYSDIGTLISQYGLKEYYDTTAEAAYYYSSSTGYFFTCDNARSVQAKANYVKNVSGYKNPFNKPLGGLISWMASLDAASEITRTSHDALFGAGYVMPSQTIEFPAMGNMSTTVTTSGADYVITIKNNNTVTTGKTAATLSGGQEANVLYYAETFAGTATYPVYYIKTANGAKLSGSAWAAGGTVGTSGDYTTVTMTAWPYYLGPGETATLTLTDPSGTANVSNIAEVAMTKRPNANGAELAWTHLYGSEGGNPVTTPATTTKQDPTTSSNTGSGGEQTSTSNNNNNNNNNNNQGTGTYPAWSSNNVAYALGDLVSYNGKVYECTYAHNSNTAWSPTDAPTLWKHRSDLVNVETPTSSGGSGGGEQETDNNYTVNGILPQHMVTGYWHNFVNGSANLKLSDVPSYYDMICVAFTGNTSTPGEVTFELDGDLCTALGGYTKAQFIQDIKNLKAKGQHVIISVGGAEGRIEINSDAAAQRFAQGLINIITEYGFEGVDIDLEGSAVSGVNYIAGALRTVHDHFGDNFIITMAPETFYIQADRLSANDITTSYLRLALQIKDILTICYPQFYNSGGMNGYGGSIVNPGNADFLTSLSTLVIESGLRPDQVAIGVPSTSKAASSGYVSTDIVKTGVNSMIYGTSSGSFTPPKAYPTFRGVMTWSINWDATNGYAWGKAMASLMDQLPTTEVPTNNPTSSSQSGGNTTTSPTEVIGLSVTSQNAGNVTFAWGQTSDQLASGQTYKVYIDGNYYSEYSAAQSVTVPLAAGTHTIKVTANLNGKETSGSTVSVTVQGSTSEETTTKAPSQGGSSTSGLQSTLLIGYWHTWHNDGNPFIKLRDVDDDWDVINISFTEPEVAGSTDGNMKFNIAGLSADYTINDFKADVKLLQSRGKKVVLAIGGYEGFFSLTSQAAVNTFVSDIKAMIDEYGFDGIDIDLEQSSVQFDSGNDPDINNPKSPKITHMINAIRTIVNSYGDDFILSWAPETFYMQMGYMYYGGVNAYCDARAGVYLPMINALREETSFVHVQLYNSIAITAPDGVSYNMGTKEATVAMCKMLLDGFYVGAGVGVAPSTATYFAPLRPDQVVIGVPSSTSAAGSGQISNANLQAAFAELNASYPGMRGIMTWSINWDSSQNNNSFANENGAFLDGYVTEVPTETPTEAPVFDAFQKIEAEKFADKSGGVIDTNSNASGGYNIGGVLNGTTLRYDNVNFSANADAFSIYYSSPSGTAQGNVEIYVDSLDNKVGTIVLSNNASSWSGYGSLTADLSSVIAAGKHTIYTKYVTTGTLPYVANIDYFSFVEATEDENAIDGGIEINGFQISYAVQGLRTVYSVESTINGKAVVESGIVYSLGDYATESQLYVGSTSEYVASFKSTSEGAFDAAFTGSSNATSYAMTMKFFAKNEAEYSAKFRIKAYAKLSDGTYVYTDSAEYSAYSVADALYQRGIMSSEAAHDYLYNDILSVVNKDYVKVDYDWTNSLV